jgi:uncharacterized protein
VRVVVAGAGGLIGTALGAALEARGDDLVRLVRHTAAAGEAQWQPDRGFVDPVLFEDVDAVVNLAGAGIADRRWTAARRSELLRSRLDTTSALARVLAEVRPSAVLVNASAVGWYGDRGDEQLDEESAPGAGFLAGLCRSWETATSAAAEAGCRVVLVRSGIVLAAHGGALAQQLPFFRLGLGGRLGPGRQWTSWITLSDEVAAIVHAIDSADLAGPVNATAPGPVTNAAFTAALGRAVHRPAVLPIPVAALNVRFGADVTREMILASQRAHPARLLSSGFQFTFPDIDAALDDVLSH